MKAFDPIFVTPRFVARDWGRKDLGDWGPKSRHAPELIGEAWVVDPANLTNEGPLGRRIALQSAGILGDLGRAPPKLRLVFPGRRTAVRSTSPVSFWTVLEPGISSIGDVRSHRTGERMRAYEGAEVSLAGGSVALEASASFLPINEAGPEPQLIRLPPVSKRSRATLFREDGLSVEMWSLPEWSRIVPDGETCHALLALGPGVRIDGRTLRPGEAVLSAAWGRPLDIVSERQGARLLVSYPDRTPTAVWRHSPGRPDPTAGQLPKPEPAQPLISATAKVEPAWAA